MTLLIGFFTVLLVLASILMVLIILMQPPRSDSGLGAALGGGGAADSAFGAESGNILSRSTIYCSIFFFVVSFGLYLAHMYVNHRSPSDLRGLPEINAVGEPEATPAVPSLESGAEATSEEAPAETPASDAVEDSAAPAPAEVETELEPAEEVPEEGVPPAPLD